MVGWYMSAYEQKRLTLGSHFQTHRGSIAERSVEGPVAGVTRMTIHTRLLSVAAAQRPSCRTEAVSVGCRSGENGGEEKV